MEHVDAVIIGAGAAGLAVAARLSREDKTVVVLERHARHGMETSSRNSEVIHAGLYYPAGSLKTRLCIEGRKRLYELGRRHGVFCRRTGKLIVALEEAERPRLETLLAQGRANGVELQLLDRREIQGLSYEVSALAALWSPETGIVDSEGLMGFYLGRAQDRGAIFLWKSELSRVERAPDGYRLWAGGMDEPIASPRVVNAAGLHADRVAALAGLDIDAAGYRLHWFKGEYFSLRRKLAVSPLVYPLPGPQGLGIHLTIDRQERHRLGPNAFPVGRLDYEVDASHREDFWRAASRYLPGLKLADLSPGTSGIRPKLSADGSFRDFIIAEESGRGLPGWVNLIGIESPGLTASPAIAEFVADLLEWPATQADFRATT